MMGNVSQAISYLSQGLQIAESSGRREEEARIRHRLGLALCDSGQLEAAYVHLDQAASLLEIIRKESTGSTDYRLSLFDLQTASYQALQVNKFVVLGTCKQIHTSSRLEFSSTYYRVFWWR